MNISPEFRVVFRGKHTFDIMDKIFSINCYRALTKKARFIVNNSDGEKALKKNEITLLLRNYGMY